MKFGVMFANTGFGSSPQGATDIAQAAEAGGFETLWTVEHVVVPSGYESQYPYDPSGKMAGGAEAFDLPGPADLADVRRPPSTERIRLATGVLVLPQRNVVITAKEIATLDHLSSGRVDARGRGRLAGRGVRRARRAVQGARAPGWTSTSTCCASCGRRAADAEKSTVAGRFVNFEDCIMRPRPANGHGADRDRWPLGRRRRSGPGGAATGSSRAAGRSRSSPSCSPSCGPRPRRPGATRTPSSSTAAAGGPGPKLDARIEQLAGIGVTEMVLPALPPDELAGVGEDLVARFG